MMRPYFIYTLLEFLDNGKNIRSAENFGKQILSTATAEQLVLISYIDSKLVDYMISPEKQWIKKLQHSDIETEEIPASEELIKVTSMIISRIKAENAESGLATDERPREAALVSKMTIGLNKNYEAMDDPNED